MGVSYVEWLLAADYPGVYQWWAAVQKIRNTPASLWMTGESASIEPTGASMETPEVSIDDHHGSYVQHVLNAAEEYERFLRGVGEALVSDFDLADRESFATHFMAWLERHPEHEGKIRERFTGLQSGKETSSERKARRRAWFEPLMKNKGFSNPSQVSESAGTYPSILLDYLNGESNLSRPTANSKRQGKRKPMEELAHVLGCQIEDFPD